MQSLKCHTRISTVGPTSAAPRLSFALFSSRHRSSHISAVDGRKDGSSSQGSPSDPAMRPRMAQPRPGSPPSPGGPPIQLLPVEKAGEEAWAGVGFVDRGEDDNKLSNSMLLKLAGGDAAALLLFAAVGRINHGGVLDVETLATALPFIAGWFSTAPFLGAFNEEATSSPSSAALTAAKCWAIATPLGLVIRGASKGYIPPTPFIIVSFVATFVVLVGWRTALAAATKQEPAPSASARAASRSDKQGNPFEFFQLLASLTKRWPSTTLAASESHPTPQPSQLRLPDLHEHNESNTNSTRVNVPVHPPPSKSLTTAASTSVLHSTLPPSEPQHSDPAQIPHASMHIPSTTHHRKTKISSVPAATAWMNTDAVNQNADPSHLSMEADTWKLHHHQQQLLWEEAQKRQFRQQTQEEHKIRQQWQIYYQQQQEQHQQQQWQQLAQSSHSMGYTSCGGFGPTQHSHDLFRAPPPAPPPPPPIPTILFEAFCSMHMDRGQAQWL